MYLATCCPVAGHESLRWLIGDVELRRLLRAVENVSVVERLLRDPFRIRSVRRPRIRFVGDLAVMVKVRLLLGDLLQLFGGISRLGIGSRALARRRARTC